MTTLTAIAAKETCRLWVAEAEPGGEHVEVEHAEQAIGEHLEDGVEGHQHGGHFPVAAGQVGPDDAPWRCSGPARPESRRCGRRAGPADSSQARANMTAGPTIQFRVSDGDHSCGRR